MRIPDTIHEGAQRATTEARPARLTDTSVAGLDTELDGRGCGDRRAPAAASVMLLFSSRRPATAAGRSVPAACAVGRSPQGSARAHDP
jgi:hypothetical protein